ncbi:hypothetical protein ACIJDA_000902 [Enterococcus faecalis]|uniref:IrrE N-terminal-like domain-containing protein n=1 Tax=Enterococcus faecalis RP2S-4 TaxID=1244145 RepID=A0ABC9TMF1_ENTFL|nr:hypothetical protein [Enterococcus faecalis]ESU74964.1 hypothetical protein P746_00902 [Enterococcus faecalis CBRD01]EHK9982342.1 hypothetical protein [Enterococcus faecalis]EHQ2579938.1 hypothetical protein [Enterococcus faecalis]EHU5030276.1 hypothetical protein [Enterococcus faecalis]EHU8827316.1 hypothetical protein [Enterococcus faecalis]
MRKKGGLSLANSLQEEYQKLVKMNYPELVTYLNNKYGPVPGSYFRTPTCKSKNSKITRSMEGLEVHHVGEDKYPNLSDIKYALTAPWEEQLPDRLVYCNLLEHTLLHTLISEKHGTLQPYFSFKADLIRDIINDYEFKREWLKVVYSQMKDNKELLIELYNRVNAKSLLNL